MLYTIGAKRFGTITAVVLALLGALALVIGASAHAELERASPPENGLLAAPPKSIELWTTERVAVGSGSPAIKLLDPSGLEQSVTNVRVNPADPRHVLADVGTLSAGTYTVVWTVRSADDGHTLTGSYAFRIGTGRAPGAATVEGETPRAWAVATRWLTFLGAAIAAAGFLYGRFIQPDTTSGSETQRRNWSIVLGGAVALVATLAEPLLQTRFPAEGTVKPTLGQAISSLPDAWWLRPVALLVVVGLGVAMLVVRRVKATSPVLHVAGGILALVALLGLALTSHASARESLRLIAIPSIVLHQWAVGLWVGGLVLLALSWPRDPSHRQTTGTTTVPLNPIREFSRYALVLALVGIGTGILNTGLVLPTVRSLWNSEQDFPTLSPLWNSDYGKVLFAKVAILVPVLGLATFHRQTLRRVADTTAAALRTTVRLEAAIVLLVVLGGSILALMAPPTVARGDIEFVNLAAPGIGTTPDDNLLVRLQVKPAKPGDNQMKVLVADPDGAPIPNEQIALVRLAFTSLDHDAEQLDIDSEPTASGGFAIDGPQLSLDGWWRVNVLIRRLGVEDVTVPFYLLLPDPNVNGFETRETAASDDARAVFERGLAGMTSMHSVHWLQRLAGGNGAVVVSEHMVRDASSGQPAASSLKSAEFEQIVIGNRRWQREPGGEWLAGESPPVYTPEQWGDNYDGASGFHLGRTEEVNGEQAQIVTFYVPGTPRLAPAYYAWWVGAESGRVLRETMVSTFHYMLYEYSDFDQPLPIDAPTENESAATVTTESSSG